MIQVFKAKDEFIRWLLIIILIIGFTFINWPFLVPLALAGIFALGLNDFILAVSRKTKWRHNHVVPLTLTFGLALFWVPLALAIYRVIVNINQPQAIETDQIVKQIHSLKEFVLTNLQRVSEWTGSDLATPARGVLESTLKKTGEITLSYSSQILGQLPAIILASFVFILVLYLLLLKSKELKRSLIHYSPLSTETVNSLLLVLKKSCSITLFSTLVVGLIQASLIGLGSLLFNEGDFWLVLTVTFLFSFIPVIGAAPMGFFLALLAFLADRTGAAIGLTIVAIIAGSIDNFVKPLIMSGSSSISPVIGFTCVVGAVIMFGLPGLLLGPVIMNLFVGMMPLLLKKD